MRMSRSIAMLLLGTGCLFFLAETVRADSYRCGRKLIHSGDSTSEVLRVCGEPHFKDRGVERIEIDGVRKDIRVHRWYYRKSRRSLEHVVLIYRGRVRGIEVRGR